MRRSRRAMLAATVGLVMALAVATALGQGAIALPDGAGRAEVERACAACHSLENILRTRRTRPQWEALIDLMILRGARVSDEDIDVIAGYLAAHFGPTE